MLSNTYYLERHLGWSGLAIDALTEFAEGYREHRPRTKYVAMFASDTADESVQFFVPDGRSHIASANEAFAGGLGDHVASRSVPTTTLDMVLEQAGIARLDLVSMDIELSEPAALRGFAIDKYKPRLVCIEAHAEVRQEILDYFAAHRYVVVGKYMRMDPTNLYFKPMD